MLPCNKISKGFTSESGVAMITVIIISAVLMVLSTGMYYVATRENSMTVASKSGSEAFSYAEGGIENVLDILNYAGTEYQLTRPRADQSADGTGYLMDPTASSRQNPANPVEMRIGESTFEVFVDEVDAYGNHCTSCGLNLASNNPAYLKIYARAQSGQGFRELQQRVKLEASGYPLTLYINGNATLNGNTSIQNQSIFVRGDFYGRNKLSLSGTDLTYGGHAGVLSTGAIFDKQNGGSSQIYTSSGGHSSYWKSAYQYDRDSRGPSGNKFTLDELENTFSTGGMLPGGLSTNQLTTLKTQAQVSGYYNGNPSGNLVLQQSDVPNRDGDLIVYIEYPSGNPSTNGANLKFLWPTSGHSGKVIVVIMNGGVKMTGSSVGSTYGVIYCPDGTVTADGSGGGNFTGFVWGKGLIDIGNFNFTMSQQFLNDPPFFAWTPTRDTAWTQVD